jgi:hypothetical protein
MLCALPSFQQCNAAATTAFLLILRVALRLGIRKRYVPPYLKQNMLQSISNAVSSICIEPRRFTAQLTIIPIHSLDSSRSYSLLGRVL